MKYIKIDKKRVILIANLNSFYCANKCSLGENKRLLSQTFYN